MLDALRNGLRGAARRPALAAAIVIPLALATATSTALFAIADGLLWRPLPFANADRTVTVELPRAEPRRSRLAFGLVDPAVAEEFQRAFKTSPIFTATVSSWPGAYFNTRIIRQTGLQVAGVDVGFFGAFGLPPALGRVFNDDDQAAALAIPSADVGVVPVILSHQYWVREFGGDPGVVGRDATILERRVSIVGVMAPGVKFPGRTDVWTPRGRGGFMAVAGFAQLSPNATIEQARAAFPLLDFQSLRDSLRPRGAEAMAFIFGATLALLLLAWVQIGGLVLAGASDRRRDVAVRLSLGATARRIAGEFAAEAAWLAGAALGVSWLAVPFLTTALISLLPDEFTKAQYLQLDWRAYAFAAGATSVGVATLTWASFRVARGSSPVLLVQRFGSDVASIVRTRRGLLIVQTGCTALMLYLAALAGFSYLNVARFNYGFDAEHVVIIEPPLRIPQGARGDASTKYFVAYWQRIADMAKQLNALDGVEAAATVYDTPIARGYTESWADITSFNGRIIDPVRARNVIGSEKLLEALGAMLLAGASFSHSDYRGRTNIVIINETLARQLSPLASVLGRRLVMGSLNATVVGVVRDLVDSTPDVPAEPLMFRPPEFSFAGNLLVVRTTGKAAALMPLLRQTVEAEFGPMRTTELRLLADDVERTVQPWRGRAVVLGLVAALGLPLSIVGLASGMLFFVRTRTRDIGIRLALGAVPAQARALVLAYARRIVGIGCVIGVGGGALVGQFMSSQLFGVRPVSPLTTITVACLIAAAAWVAAYLPARRASQVDPVVALRAE